MLGGKLLKIVIFILLCSTAFSQQIELLNTGTGSGNALAKSIAKDSSENYYIGGFWNNQLIYGSLNLSTGTSTSDPYLLKLNSFGEEQWLIKGTELGSGDARNTATQYQNDGSVITVGFFSNTLSYGGNLALSAGSRDGYAAKIDTNGNGVWNVSMGGTGVDEVYNIAISGDDIYLVGYFQSTATFGTHELTSIGNNDGFLAKLDSDGDFLWAVGGGSTGSESINGVAVDNDGNIYISGSVASSGTFDGQAFTSSGQDGMLAKYNSAGELQWLRNYGNAQVQIFEDIVIDNDGNLVVTGYFRNTFTLGTDFLSASGTGEILIAKFDTDGNVIKARSIGSSDDDYPNGLIVDSDNNVIITGYTRQMLIIDGNNADYYGGTDGFLVRLDSDLDYLNAVGFGSTSIDIGNGMVLDSYENVILCIDLSFNVSQSGTIGNLTTPATINGDAFIVKAKYIRPIGISVTSTDVGPNSILINAVVADEANSAVSERGVVWSTSPTPTIALSTKQNSGSGLGSFSIQIDGLENNTTYYVRAYATNSEGTTYSNEIELETIDYSREIDGNQDQIPDTIQANVVTVYNKFTKDFLTVVSTNNRSISDIYINESEDPDYTYPLGQVEFKSAGPNDIIKVGS